MMKSVGPPHHSGSNAVLESWSRREASLVGRLSMTNTRSSLGFAALSAAPAAGREGLGPALRRLADSANCGAARRALKRCIWIRARAIQRGRCSKRYSNTAVCARRQAGTAENSEKDSRGASGEQRSWRRMRARQRRA